MTETRRPCNWKRFNLADGVALNFVAVLKKFKGQFTIHYQNDYTIPHTVHVGVSLSFI